MKKIFSILFILQATASYAQEVSVSLSNEFKIRNKEMTTYSVVSEGFVYKEGDFFYRLESSPKGPGFSLKADFGKLRQSINLYKYDISMKEIKKESLEGGEKVFGPFRPQLIQLKNKLLLFYYKYYEDATLNLFVSEVNKETMGIENTKELFVIPLKEMGFLPLVSAEDYNKLLIQISPDTTKLLVMHVSTGKVNSCIIDKNINVTNNTVSKTPALEKLEPQSAFIDNIGNKYLGYEYTDDKISKRGLFVQNIAGKESFQTININQQDYMMNDLSFASSKDDSKVYMYANYYSQQLNEGWRMFPGSNYGSSSQNEGVAVAAVSADKLKIDPINIMPYPDEFRQKIYKLNCGDKRKGHYTVNTIGFEFHEFENGTIAMIGYGEFTREGQTIQKTFAGSIVSIFINKAKMNFTIIPRQQDIYEGSDCISIFSKNNIICIYTDNKKNIEAALSDKVKEDGDPECLAAIVINTDGTIASRKIIAKDPIGSNYYFTSKVQQLSGNTFLMPIGRTKTTFTKYVTDYVQWATLEIQ